MRVNNTLSSRNLELHDSELCHTSTRGPGHGSDRTMNGSALDLDSLDGTGQGRARGQVNHNGASQNGSDRAAQTLAVTDETSSAQGGVRCFAKALDQVSRFKIFNPCDESVTEDVHNNHQ